ncbi:hypothetical protein [Methylovulum psychrotolerans]|uniref:Uncharacterized protein n=1 Tax=Methylovulum psychrotolerans TaxID=1704499 RepID=A0A2S5CPV9_9GAMM|nr:hypothetical protein [Methylovulum psychrotolerans]POZ52850.1 hypothetical protein AADEFJLK_01459 [Methylovulum psychrotolerans]
MKIQLEAYAPPDATAILRIDGKLGILTPPYRLGREVNVQYLPQNDDAIIENAVFKQSFSPSTAQFDNWEALFSFLRQAHQEFHAQFKPLDEHHTDENSQYENDFSDFDDETLQEIIDEIKSVSIPQKRLIYAKNIVTALLKSDIPATFKAQADPLKAQLIKAEQEYLNSQPKVILNPELEEKLSASVGRLSWDGQRLFLDWLKRGLYNADWQIDTLLPILEDEPLEMIRDEDWVFNIAAQALKSAVALFQGLKREALLKPFLLTIRQLDNNRLTWDDDLFDIAYYAEWTSLLNTYLPKLHKVIRHGETFQLMMSNKLAIVCIPNSRNISLKGSMVTIKMSRSIYEEKLPEIQKVERGFLNMPNRTESEVKATALHIYGEIIDTHRRQRSKLSNLYEIFYRKVLEGKPSDIDNILNREINKLSLQA